MGEDSGEVVTLGHTMAEDTEGTVQGEVELDRLLEFKSSPFKSDIGQSGSNGGGSPLLFRLR